MLDLVAYELMSANDAPERDPMDWYFYIYPSIFIFFLFPSTFKYQMPFIIGLHIDYVRSNLATVDLPLMESQIIVYYG